MLRLGNEHFEGELGWALENRVRLREDLPREEQEILVLRVDKQLAWDDLARVLWEGVEPPSDEELKRESVRLRKRFQTIKDRLRELWRREATFDSEQTRNSSAQ